MSPSEALQILRRGNDRFLSGPAEALNTDRRLRLELAKKQQPFAAYLSCSDSRVPPELLFGRGLGDLFIVRNAGNSLDVAALGSLEYAVHILKVPLIVVMGHEGCGAVGAAVSAVQDEFKLPGSIAKVVQAIIPAVLEATRTESGIGGAVRHNVRRVVRELREDASPILLEPQALGALQIVGAHYSLVSGRVDFFDLPGAWAEEGAGPQRELGCVA